MPTSSWGTLLVPFLVTILLALTAAAEDKPCTLHHDRKFYDLSPLTSDKDYELKTPGGNKFVINVCKAISHETWALKVENPSEVAGFVRRDHGDISIGKVNTTLDFDSGHVRLVMNEGSKCKGDSLTSSTVIEFTCDTSAGKGSPRLVAQLPPGDENACGFFLEWKTKHACETSEGGGFWGFIWTLILMVFFLLLAYLILGGLYNRFVLNLRGWDQVPQFSIESMKYHAAEAWDWAKDIMGKGGAARANGYGPLSVGPGASFERRPTPSRGGSRVNPVSHQAEVAGIVNNEPPSAPEVVGGFVRPARKSEMNPVSHQSQVQAEFSRPSAATAAASLSFTPPPPSTQRGLPPKPKAFDLDDKSSTREEREFMLVDDEDDEDEGQELTSIQATPSSPAQQGEGAPPSGSEAAAMRGRDTGDGGVIRL